MKYTKEWNNFDWSIIQSKIEAAEKELSQSGGKINKSDIDIGITSNEFVEYFEWLYNNDPDEYYKITLYLCLRKIGASHEEAECCLSHPEVLEQVMNIIRNTK